MKFHFARWRAARKPGTRRARGVTYAVVLLTTILVATIGFFGLAVVRVQGRVLQLTADVGIARRICLAGLDWAVFAISTDTSWRSNLGATWASNFTVGEGRVTIEAVDPIDGVMANDSLHPVDLTVTGTAGKARQKCKARIVMSPQRSVLACSLATDGALTINNSLLNAEGPVYADTDLTATSAQVTADVEAVGTITGASFAGTQQPGAAARKFPNPALTVYYEAVGTPIALSQLVWSSDNLITNGDFSGGSTGWTVRDTATFQVESSGPMAAAAVSGSPSLEPWALFSNRSSDNAGPVQDIRAALESSGPGKYRIQMLIAGGTVSTPAEFEVELKFDPEKGGAQTHKFTSSPATGQWQWVSGEFDLTWDTSGALKTASMRVSTKAGRQDFRIDDISLQRLCTTCPYILKNVLLSPTSNPFGSTNASGMYVINCAGADLTVRDLRIVGTLYLKNPGPNSRIEGMVAWEPAVANYPALIVSGNIRIELTTGRLAEKTLAVNFNPPGTPYRFPNGMSDSNKTGFITSEIRGLIYATGRIALGGRSNIFGPVIAVGDIAITSQQVGIRYDETYSLRPPPGFELLRPEPQIMAGSIQQLVD